MTVMGKKDQPTLIAAVRRAVANGMTWDEFARLCAPEFGAIMREGEINGFRPMPKEKRKP